ncbi:uncharacterized protein LOC113521608 isoform X2 [Galleria mellonella]|uniref:Uncharacterized protein LOC113521608 isoform X2 n=1 Tax=Galleria mellonella TaxID=7137 RepID=A0ABM3MWF5_GALME|nr:uncharacterized protein LOC113521608 isoform X2 [Galleria mellonella]
MTDFNNVVFPRKLLKKFILLYKEQACLWDRQSVLYKNKQKRHDAVSKLTELVREYDPGATRVHVLRKIESLRACVRREHKRVLDSRRKATSDDEIYTPQLWYYDLFSFVFKEEGSNHKIKTDTTPTEQESEEEEVIDNEEQSFETQTYPIEYNTMVEVSESPSTSKPYAFEEDQNKNGKRPWTEIEDEYDAIEFFIRYRSENGSIKA